MIAMKGSGKLRKRRPEQQPVVLDALPCGLRYDAEPGEPAA